MNALAILEQLEQTSGSSAKIEILKQHKDNKELVELLDAALNFKRKFYIKKIELYPGEPRTRHENPHDTFMSLLNTLHNRDATGNLAHDIAHNFFAMCEDNEAKWYHRVLLKDLKCNFGISSCTKAGIYIPEFEVMLAKDGKECKNLREIVGNGVFVTPKLDGYRCLAVCNHGDVTLYSRNGSEYENFPTIIEKLQELCQHSKFVLDGEIMSNDFNSMQQSAFASKRGTTVGDVKYHIFGWISHDEWTTGEFKMPTKQRLANLEAWFDSIVNPDKYPTNLIMVEYKLVYQIEEILQCEQEFLAEGYEGAMALPNIPYYLGKKSNKLMKFKTMLSQDCKLVGIYEGTGKYEESMGGINVVQENGKACDVGSGFKDKDREYMYTHQSEFIGRTVEIKYQELSADGIMRFPIFLRFRDFNPGSGKI